MLPPVPAATIAFKSPNACNLCHTDKDAAWSDEWVRKWYPRDYQAEVLRRAELIDQARKRDWQRLPDMLAELKNNRQWSDLQNLAGTVVRSVAMTKANGRSSWKCCTTARRWSARTRPRL